MVLFCAALLVLFAGCTGRTVVLTTMVGGADNTTSGGNSSFNEEYANTLYAPITTVSDNASWNETRASVLYYPLSANPSGYLTSYTETDAIANGKIDTIQNLTLGQIGANIGNASKLVGTCGVNTVVQNVTASGVQCVADQAGTSTVANITAFMGLGNFPNIGAIAATTTPTLFSKTVARGCFFEVEQGTQLTFNEIGVPSTLTNASIGVNFAVYNCTTSGATTCSLLINTSRTPLTASTLLRATNASVWVLPAGYYRWYMALNGTQATAAFYGFGNTNHLFSNECGSISVTEGAFPTSMPAITNGTNYITNPLFRLR